MKSYWLYILSLSKAVHTKSYKATQGNVASQRRFEIKGI